MRYKTVLLLISFSCVVCGSTYGDILPPGHKNVHHRLVFESSSIFDWYRIVAGPTHGVGGTQVVIPGQPVRFSSKYGTRFYLIPESVTDIPKYDRELFEQWPNTQPPVSEIRSVPIFSPVVFVMTTVNFVGVEEGKPVIEVIGHKQLDRYGNPASYWRAWWWLVIPLACGVVLCGLLIKRLRRQGGSVSTVANE